MVSKGRFLKIRCWIGSLLLLSSVGCSSSIQIRKDDYGWASYRELTRVLNLGSSDSGEVRLYHERGLLLPFHLYRIQFDSSGDNATLNAFGWWAYDSLEAKETAEQLLKKNFCRGPLQYGKEVLACSISCDGHIDEPTLRRIREARDSVSDESNPRDVGRVLENPDGTVSIVADGSTVIIEVHPFEISSAVAVHNPQLCSEPICELASDLLSALESACFPEPP